MTTCLKPCAVVPATDANGDSVSSSGREDVQEARERYENELASDVGFEGSTD